jgi:hypothetical protein
MSRCHRYYGVSKMALSSPNRMVNELTFAEFFCGESDRNLNLKGERRMAGDIDGFKKVRLNQNKDDQLRKDLRKRRLKLEEETKRQTRFGGGIILLASLMVVVRIVTLLVPEVFDPVFVRNSN